ncbi:hypothetical protein RIF29_41271 [Crotalaria pallida]|uniref:Uncharacterized protein n=1 Tax=Crotalaria pallida TaxID=3830 RepID=A0AAN9E4N5_CROPI
MCLKTIVSLVYTCVNLMFVYAFFENISRKKILEAQFLKRKSNSVVWSSLLSMHAQKGMEKSVAQINELTEVHLIII